MNKLVVYYSLDGNTRFVAREINRQMVVDLHELKPLKEVGRKEPVKHLWGGKQVLMREVPGLAGEPVKLESYDMLFIGTPVWSFTYSPPVRSFLKNNKVEGFKIVLFCTHRGFPGMTLRSLRRELEQTNQIIGEVDFKNVLKKPEAAREKLSQFLLNIN